MPLPSISQTHRNDPGGMKGMVRKQSTGIWQRHCGMWWYRRMVHINDARPANRWAVFFRAPDFDYVLLNRRWHPIHHCERQHTRVSALIELDISKSHADELSLLWLAESKVGEERKDGRQSLHIP